MGIREHLENFPISVLVKDLRELNPDLVAFQEAIKTDDYDQPEEWMS